MALRLPDAEALGARPLPSAITPVVREDSTAVARAAAEVGRTTTELAEKVYRRDAEREVSEYRARLNRLEIDKIYDPEKGFINKRGKDAVDGYESFSEQMHKSIDTETAKVSNPMARAAAAEIAASRRGQFDQWLSGHVGREREVYDAAVFDVEQKTSRQRAALDPARADVEARNAGVSAMSRARRLGLPPEVAVAEAQAGVHGAVIDGHLARGEYAAADAYARSHQKVLGEKADEYLQRTERSIEHAERVAEVRRERTERDVRVATNKKLYDSDPAMPVEQVFSEGERAAIAAQPGLMEALRREQTGRLQGTETQTVPAELERLRSLAGTNPQAFIATDITKSYGKLALRDRDYLETLQKTFSDPTKQAQFATEQQQIAKYYDLMGVKGGDKGDKVRGAFQTAYQNEARAFVADKKREPNADEREAILKRITLPFMRDSRWFGNEVVPAFKLKPDDEGVKVPLKHRNQIIADFQHDFKREPTEQEIIQEYVLRAGH